MNSGQKQAPRVLFIEDAIAEREELVAFLELKGYDVRCVDDGTQALEALRSERCDVIILDIMMPSGEELKGRDVAGGYATGKEVLRVLREEMRLDTPVIVSTAHPGLKLEEEMRSLGVFAYVNKPISPDDLERIIAKAPREVR